MQINNKVQYSISDLPDRKLQLHALNLLILLLPDVNRNTLSVSMLSDVNRNTSCVCMLSDVNLFINRNAASVVTRC